jgi:hypothetical protein
METPCIFCLNELRYVVDSSLSVVFPRKRVMTFAAGAGTMQG